MFVVERAGTIRIIDGNGSVLPTPFLDITDRVNSTSGEQGLLGMTFHPQYASNGYFYVNYINGSGNGSTRISRFSVTGDPNVADPNSELIIYTVAQPATNHNGGDLAFGPDGHLWFPLGDGGTDQTAQDMTSPLGKVIRIDVNSGSPYSIPSDNPYANGDPSLALPEIWASGLRNPFRFSFDALTGDVWIADVGQSTYEEINLVAAGDHSGANFGWRCYEGPMVYNGSGCAGSSAYDFPIQSHPQTDGWCSVIGGFVYRGSAIPDLYGKYVYSDFCHGQIFTLEGSGTNWTSALLHPGDGFGPSTFGQDANGELWLANTINGQVYRIEGTAPAGSVQIDLKVFLEGPFDQNAGLMSDALRAGGLVPLQEPYTGIGAPQVAGGGGESTSGPVLSVTGSSAVVDWIRVELRSTQDQGEILATRQGLLLRNGEVVMGNGTSEITFDVAPGSYFVAVGHRNHLPAMTAVPIALSASPVTVDLRVASTATYGTGARKTMGSWTALWAGDVSSDGTIKYSGTDNDRDRILTTIGGVSPTATATGYTRSDVNMDGVVRYTGAGNDRDHILVNIGGVVPTQTKVKQVP